MAVAAGEVWITGIGLVSSLGEGVEAHWHALTAPDRAPRIETERYAPYTVHPLVPIDLARFIPKTSDQRQMERWQRIGVHAAGLALADAGVLGNPELLDRTDLCIAAGNGDRDIALDAAVLGTLAPGCDDPGLLNRQLMTGLRPTLYLGELSNLLAGNIQIVLKATGSSRTFKGEEMAGLAALEDACARLAAGTSEIALAGGALNAEREDLLLNMELCGNLHRGPFAPVWQRDPSAGMCLGSVGAFLVLERRRHAEARGARPYAALRSVLCDRPMSSEKGAAAHAATALLSRISDLAPVAVLSGASGVAAATAEETTFLHALAGRGKPPVRAYGSLLGHGLEAHACTGAALAAISLSRGGTFYPPFSDGDVEAPSATSVRDVLVTSFGSWRGVGMAMLGAVEGDHR